MGAGGVSTAATMNAVDIPTWLQLNDVPFVEAGTYQDRVYSAYVTHLAYYVTAGPAALGVTSFFSSAVHVLESWLSPTPRASINPATGPLPHSVPNTDSVWRPPDEPS